MMLDKNFFNKLAVETSKKYRALIFDPKGKGKKATEVYGKPYKTYKNPQSSNSYGVRKKSGNLKGIDKTPQDGKFKDSKAPVLTGALMNSFGTAGAYTTGFGFGTVTKRGLVKKLEDMGRVVSNNQKPVPDGVADYIMGEFDKNVKGAFKKLRRKYKRKKINIII